MTATPKDDAFLHDRIAERLSDNNIRDITFEMGGAYEYEELAGETKSAKARELVRLAQRRDELPLLLDCLHAQNEAVDWPAAKVPPLPLHQRPRGKLIIGLGVLAFLIAAAALLTWLYYRPSALWATNAPVDPDALGIAVAELGISADCRRGAAGREASALLYQTLEEQIAGVGLRQRAPLTRVGLICDQEQAIEAGRRVAADLVIWGWVPQSTGGIWGQYTFVDPPEGVGAEALSKGLELLVGGPGQARFYSISGRTESLVRFVLGLVYAKQKDYESALTMFNRAIAIIEGDPEAVDDDSLAVLYTERGKVQAAMSNPDETFVSYRKAESLNPDYIGLQIAFGAYYYSLREWDNARRYFQQARLQEEPLPAISYGLGLLEYYDGEYAAAATQLEKAVTLTQALDEEPILPWLALGYTYAELGDCPASDAAFAAIVGSETAEDDIRAAAEVETGRCGRAKQISIVSDPAATPTAMPTLIAAMTRALPGGAFGAPDARLPGVTICALAATELRAGPGTEFAAAARLEAGGAATWLDGVRAGDWLRVSLAPGFEVWASGSAFTTCAGGTPWAATGVPPVVWPTSLPPLPTLLATPLLPTLLPPPLMATPTETILPQPTASPDASRPSDVLNSETPQTILGATATMEPLPSETPTLFPTWPATATQRPQPTEPPTETPAPPPQPTATDTLLPAPSETFIPGATEEATPLG